MSPETQDVLNNFIKVGLPLLFAAYTGYLHTIRKIVIEKRLAAYSHFVTNLNRIHAAKIHGSLKQDLVLEFFTSCSDLEIFGTKQVIADARAIGVEIEPCLYEPGLEMPERYNDLKSGLLKSIHAELKTGGGMSLASRIRIWWSARVPKVKQ